MNPYSKQYKSIIYLTKKLCLVVHTQSMHDKPQILRMVIMNFFLIKMNWAKGKQEKKEIDC